MRVGACGCVGVLCCDVVGRPRRLYADPFPDFSNETLVHITMNNERPEMPEDAPADYAALVGVCWDQQPSRRLLAEQVVRALTATASERQAVAAQTHAQFLARFTTRALLDAHAELYARVTAGRLKPGPTYYPRLAGACPQR